MAVFAPLIVKHSPYISLEDADGIVMKNLSPKASGTFLERTAWGAHIFEPRGLRGQGLHRRALRLWNLHHHRHHLGRYRRLFRQMGGYDHHESRGRGLLFPVMFLVIIFSTMLKPSIYQHHADDRTL